MHAHIPMKQGRTIQLLWLSWAAALPALGCSLPAPTYDYGVALGAVELQLIADDQGVHPSAATLRDPNNPFADDGIADEARWLVQDAGYWPASFYAWSTALALRPNGENQLYTALAAQQLYERREADPALLYPLRSIAINGYQAILDHFPDDVTYDATGTLAYPVAPTAFAAIEALGATPIGWVRVEGDDGTVALVRAPGLTEDDTGGTE